MPTLTLETMKMGPNTFELHQTESIGFWTKNEIIKEIEAPDRMIAAMINLGLACKWFADRDQDEPRIIALMMDQGYNNDELNGHEHNDLFKVIRSLYDAHHTGLTEFRQERLKYQAMYGNYVRYLDKILFYVEQWEIQTKLIQSVVTNY